MQFRSLFFLIVFALPSYASFTLYDELKNLPQTYVQPFFELFPDGSIHPVDDTLSQELNHFRMNEMLQKQFIALDIGADDDYLVEEINVNEALPGRYRSLVEDTIYIQFAMITAVGALAVMPESISKWDMKTLNEQSLGERWKENVTTKPVWDKDAWAINYIGHPISGAIYYSMARNDGMSIFESAAYSTILSTFFWEYGYESFAEKPSVQDQIFTPLIGSFLGEGMHILEGKLDANGGKIWGSKELGSFSYFWLDPMGNMAGGLSDIFDISVTLSFENYPHFADASQFRFENQYTDPVRFQDRDYGFMLTFQ
ncbi:MAG: DUF3943 domain-containing protein [Helicobacteraceae bacterium]|jgi:hypothetical protein|nr:DUF3943 domain-containing protein [Helicobacteraceae bacterium]